MAAAYYDIEVEQGATWRRIVAVKDENDEPVDLTGYTVRMDVRETVDSPSALLHLETGAGITLDGPAGRFTIEIADETSSAWAWRYGVYDLELESPGGEVDRLLKGKVLVSREVTR